MKKTNINNLFKENRLVMHGPEAPGDPLESGLFDSPDAPRRGRGAQETGKAEIARRERQAQEEARQFDVAEATRGIADCVRIIDRVQRKLRRIEKSTKRKLGPYNLDAMHARTIAVRILLQKADIHGCRRGKRGGGSDRITESPDMSATLSRVKENLLWNEFGLQADASGTIDMGDTVNNRLDTLSRRSRDKVWGTYNKFAGIANAANRMLMEVEA